jgi:hypothetical protein
MRAETPPIELIESDLEQFWSGGDVASASSP